MMSVHSYMFRRPTAVFREPRQCLKLNELYDTVFSVCH